MRKGLTDLMEGQDDRADLTPMIDCVFLLLLFFIVTSTFTEESNLFEIEIPTAENAEVRQVSDVMVAAIAENGDISIQNEIIDTELIYQYLDGINSKTPIDTIIIKGDKNCPYEKVIMVMDVAQALGIGEVTLAVEGR